MTIDNSAWRKTTCCCVICIFGKCHVLCTLAEVLTLARLGRNHLQSWTNHMHLQNFNIDHPTQFFYIVAMHEENRSISIGLGCCHYNCPDSIIATCSWPSKPKSLRTTLLSQYLIALSVPCRLGLFPSFEHVYVKKSNTEAQRRMCPDMNTCV